MWNQLSSFTQQLQVAGAQLLEKAEDLAQNAGIDTSLVGTRICSAGAARPPKGLASGRAASAGAGAACRVLHWLNRAVQSRILH